MLWTPAKTDDFSRRLRAAIEDRLAALNVSARQASLAVIGHDSLIKEIRAGRLPSADRLEALADYLGLEFYIGPPRQLDPDAPEPATVTVDGAAFTALPMYNAEVSAGPGRNVEAVEVEGLLAFSQLWLQKHGIAPATASLVRLHGDSMTPTLGDGDLVLIDGARTKVLRRHIYALVDVEGDTRVKRLERLDRATLALLSDNPSYPLELRRGPDLDRLRILGEVRWSGHAWR